MVSSGKDEIKGNRGDCVGWVGSGCVCRWDLINHLFFGLEDDTD
jgi:hypothetical protein